MTIDGITNNSGGSPGGGPIYNTPENTLGKDAFLQLLVTQLQNQDPLNPQEGAEFVAQLAQFSTVEQLDNVNNNLGVLQIYENALNNALAVGYIGKSIQASGYAVDIGTGEPAELEFTIGENAEEVQIDLYDAAGRFVRRLEPGALAAGEQVITWDGKDFTGRDAAPGAYTFEVKAYDAEGDLMETNAFVEGVVSGVEFKYGRPYLLTEEGGMIPLASVIRVTAPEESETASVPEHDLLKELL